MFLLHIYTVVGVMGRDGGIGHRAYRYKASDARKAVIQWTTVYRKQAMYILTCAFHGDGADDYTSHLLKFVTVCTWPRIYHSGIRQRRRERRYPNRRRRSRAARPDSSPVSSSLHWQTITPRARELRFIAWLNADQVWSLRRCYGEADAALMEHVFGGTY